MVKPPIVTIALQYLIAPATSVASERMFSKAGDILDKKRSTLKPKRIEKILFASNYSYDDIFSV